MRTMDWKPNEDLIKWGNEHFKALSVDAMWTPQDSGVQFMKTAEDTFQLVFMYNHPTAREHYEKLSLLLKECGYKVLQPDDVEVQTPPLNPQMQMQMEHEHKQKVAQGWKCQCGYPLANNELEKNVLEFVETIDAELDDGTTAPLELWRYIVPCNQCGDDISIDPDDFLLLAGDEAFMKWNNGEESLQALTRNNIVDLAEAGCFDESVPPFITLLGKTYKDEKVPPWMWGTTVRIVHHGGEEE